MNEWAFEALSLAAKSPTRSVCCWLDTVGVLLAGHGRCAAGWRSCSWLLRERQAAVISEHLRLGSGSAAYWF